VQHELYSKPIDLEISRISQSVWKESDFQ